MVAYSYLKGRGATRLCHFTKVKSLVHILTSEDGIIATDFINKDIKQQNDFQRLDNKTDHVCCSLQYPNSWFLRKVRDRDTDLVFKEWVILVIDLGILKEQSFKFCPCNASKGCGCYISGEVASIAELFSHTIGTRNRTPQMLMCCPTDDQAEILVYKNVPLRFVTGIIVGNNESANNIGAILKTIGKHLPVFVSPSVCSTVWSDQVRSGQTPLETEYYYRGE